MVHNLRLLTALAPWKVADWPWPGRVVIRERHPEGKFDEAHLFDRWCHLGTARSEEELESLLETRREIEFDPDVYKIVQSYVTKHRGLVTPVPPAAREAIPAAADLEAYPT